MKRAAGVTLLEVLIAVMLLSVVSVGMMMAMRIGMAALARTNSRLMENRRVAGAQRVLDQQLEGLIPAFVPCGPGDTADGKEKVIFFGGQPNSLTIASTFSLQESSRGRPQILQFFTIPDDKGGVRLVVNEVPYTGVIGAGQLCAGVDGGEEGQRVGRFQTPSASSASFVLADHLKWVRFFYLAPSRDPDRPSQWVPAWVRGEWPSGIRVAMEPLEPSPARLQPLTVTVPVYISRDPTVLYEDR